ncbi:hypothetical protein Hypma_016332 [Hypsizygus marmoreus]|uniref:Uncharacterized protein n=1 Tax=Hypsizygus marmoreus TaxID=39966 RepID=A0A369IYJ2_HYPMA|nr:hypothetical protein Hypma_016332 [Hypsizygus marmoreus]
MPAKPLPHSMSRQPLNHDWITSYNLLRDCEAQYLADRDKLVPIRLLGHLMNELRDDSSVDHIHRVVSTASDLVQLGKFYIKYLITTFRRNKGPTPAPTEHPSRESFEDLCEDSYHQLLPAQYDHRTAKYYALERDDYRCSVCGAFDYASTKEFPKIATLARQRYSVNKVAAGETNAAHIIPEGLSSGLKFVDVTGDAEEREVARTVLPDGLSEPDKNANPIPLFNPVEFPLDQSQAHQSSSMYSVLRVFGHPPILDELNGTFIHRLENILTLCSHEHSLFNSLDIYFEPTDIENEYYLRAVYEFIRPSKGPGVLVDTVTFAGTDDKPAPSPDYLALHATCCKVAHMLGAAEYLDEIERDFDEVAVEAHFVSSPAVCDALIRSLEVTVIGQRVGV